MLHWIKQSVAVTLGLLLGFFSVTGWLGYAIAVATLYGATVKCLTTVKIPDTTMTLADGFQEGLMPAIMTFTVRK